MAKKNEKIRRIFVKAELLFFCGLGLLLAVFAYFKSGIKDSLAVVAFVILAVIIDKIWDAYKKKYDQ